MNSARQNRCRRCLARKRARSAALLRAVKTSQTGVVPGSSPPFRSVESSPPRTTARSRNDGRVWPTVLVKSLQIGGFGSGQRFGYAKRRVVEDCLALDVNRLAREGVLTAGAIGSMTWGDTAVRTKATSEALTLTYKVLSTSGGSETIRYDVPLTRTASTFGGSRAWFACPGEGCGRRVAKLFLVGRYFLCRVCHRLIYQSTLEAREGRARLRAQRIRRRLGGSGSLLVPFPSKPKGMHWRTYARLQDEEGRALLQALAD